MYILAFFYGIIFVLGFLTNQFSSAFEFAAYFIQDQGLFLLTGRLVVAGFGIATLVVVYKIALRVSGNFTAAYIATLVAAILAPMVLGSIVVKADVPAGFFVLLSVYYFLKTTDDTQSLKPLIIASLLSGVAMGTKYFGIILLPGFMLTQLFLKYDKQISWGNLLSRILLIATLFVAGFFIVSPYNFLDSEWGPKLIRGVFKKLDPSVVEAGYNSDSRTFYQKGLGAIPGALMDIFSKLPRSNFLGWPIVILACAGFLGLLREKKFSPLFILIMPIACYFGMAAFMVPYHVAPRHLNAIFPFFCIFFGLGVYYLTSLFQLSKKIYIPVIIVIVCISIFPTARLTKEEITYKLKSDSRVEAYKWIKNNIPKDSVILLDDCGPVLSQNQATAKRLLADLATFKEKDAFTAKQQTYLELILKYPPDYGFDIYRLGHQWWLPEELTDEELRSSAKHRDMSNPLVSRVPKRISEYQKMGIQYIITNSRAQGFYEKGDIVSASFPSFTRFYGELEGQKLIHKFDPATFNGKGPIVFIYTL